MAADGDVVYDWSTAPREMREAFEKMQADSRKLQQQAEAAAKRLAEVDRREKFNDLKAAGGDTLKDVTLEDIGDLGAEQITPTILQAKALEKASARAAAETEMAKNLGFESVEALQTFRAEAQARNAATLEAQARTASAASSGQTFTEPVMLPGEAAFKAYNEARTKGLPSDDAGAAAVDAMIQATLAQAQAQAAK